MTRHLKTTPATQPWTRRNVLSAAVAASTATAASAMSVAATPTAVADAPSLWRKVYSLDASTLGSLSVAIHDRRSGAMWTYNPNFRNECASIVKVLVLATVCDRTQQSGRSLSTWERTQASAMIRYSDNASTTRLWTSVGGAGAVQSLAYRLGMRQTMTSRSWGLTRTSAYDQVVLQNEIAYRGAILNAANRAYIAGLMGSVTPSQRWGVGSVGIAQVKNGWLPYAGAWRINSVGHVTGGGRDYTLSILQRISTMNSGIDVANRAASIVYNHLATPL